MNQTEAKLEKNKFYKDYHSLSTRATYSPSSAMNGGQVQLPKLMTSGPEPAFLTMSESLIAVLDFSSMRAKSGNNLPANIAYYMGFG